MEEFKTDYKFKELNEYLNSKNIKEENLDSLIEILPNYLIKKCFYLHIEENKGKYKYNIEPEKIKINYINDQKLNNSIIIYNNFEILDKKIFDCFRNLNTKIKVTLVYCIQKEGKIIIKMPYNLNKKYFILIGILDNNKVFILEYIAIYNNEFGLKNHLNKISKNLDQYLNNLKLENNRSPIIIGDKQKIGGIIIRYKTDNINSGEGKKQHEKNVDKKLFEKNEKKKKLEKNKNQKEFEKNESIREKLKLFVINSPKKENIKNDKKIERNEKL